MSESTPNDPAPSWLTSMQTHAEALLDQHERLADLLRRSDTPPLDEFDAVFETIRQHNDGMAEAEQARLEWTAAIGTDDMENALAEQPEHTRNRWADLKEMARRFRQLSQANLMALRRIDQFLGERIDFLLQRDESGGSLYTAKGSESQTGGRGRTLGDA
ncbi:flagellar protein FlgN [Guyparkeria hydrothermalis]|uniref:flagellar export chaperone FlgN n=1 Tax=Guyparkeria hydrothermalis TaxID=923 RepID=UPI0020227BD1|nr:flagellar export chaperone FlgN [Guyparkeria hydrothermalis]MCL7743430.1 flagellar protein FlgN [Guyparkeria hydrothermalis]